MHIKDSLPSGTNNKKNRYAPIVLFVYNRYSHTRATVEALEKNELAKKSVIYIYSDAPKAEKDEIEVQKVRAYLKTIAGFEVINIVERKINRGLALSIVDGVTEICRKYGRVIVLEDDIVTSPYFLRFMNEALERYRDSKQVWHISGWNYPIENNGLPESFFWRTMNCWGWATWNDRWERFEKNPQKLVAEWERKQIKRFNVDGTYNFWRQVKANHKGKLNTWAVFWYATLFSHNGLCLNPTMSYTHNIGNDGSGENCGTVDDISTHMANSVASYFPSTIKEDAAAVGKIKAFYSRSRPSFIFRVFRRLKATVKNVLAELGSKGGNRDKAR